jgi:hypothetical protein
VGLKVPPESADAHLGSACPAWPGLREGLPSSVAAFTSSTRRLYPLPRTRFEAMVVASSPMRRSGLVARLRALGAREVIEAGTVAKAKR